MRVGLVSCSAGKLAVPAPACVLYNSQLFKAASWYASKHYDAWYILSAKHGLVKPNTVLEPYNVTLNNMSVVERHTWTMDLIVQMRLEFADDDVLYVHAGELYCDWTGAYWATSCPWDINVPLRGMGIGQRLGWYKRAGLAVA